MWLMLASFHLKDHPRSRGVYILAPVSVMWVVGSSPLARGLPCMRARERRALRIIPARAGFTKSDEHDDWSHGDHPRSRGVYSTCPALIGSA